MNIPLLCEDSIKTIGFKIKNNSKCFFNLNNKLISFRLLDQFSKLNNLNYQEKV